MSAMPALTVLSWLMDQQQNLVSDSFFDKDTWAALNPESIHAVEHRGKYLFFL